MSGAQLYGADPDDGVGGAGAFFLLLDEPEVYGLPPDPVVTSRDAPQMWRRAALAAVTLLVVGRRCSRAGAREPGHRAPIADVAGLARPGRRDD